MEHDLLDEALSALTPSEQRFLDTHRRSDSYASMATATLDGKTVYVFDGYIPEGEDYVVRRHGRFASVPTHIHNFIEIAYVYRGGLTQTICGREVHLSQGESCLIDTNVPHSIGPTGVDDIIINILIRREYLDSFLMRSELGHNIISDFIVTAMSATAGHNQYVIFQAKQDNRMQQLIRDILSESLFPQISSREAIGCLIPLLFIELLRAFDYTTNREGGDDSQIPAILRYIDVNYENLSLTKLASHFGYSPSYLSALIKKYTGKKYTEIVIEKRLEKARSLLRSTSLRVNEVAQLAGFSNPTFFYKKYKEAYHQLPSQRS